MGQDSDPSTLSGWEAHCGQAGGTAGRNARRSGLADRAARLKARRAKKRDAHEREMDQRINETMEKLRVGLEGFCETHFVRAGGSGGADGEAGVWHTLDAACQPFVSGNDSMVTSLGPLSSGAQGTSMHLERHSPLGGGMPMITRLYGLSVDDPEDPEDPVGLVGARRHRGGTSNGIDEKSWLAFCRVCSSAGLDPLLLYHSVSLKQVSRPVMVSSVAYKKYLNALSVVVLDVCDAQRVLTGGLCSLDTMAKRVQRRGGAWLDGRGEERVKEDIIRAVDIMRSALAGVEGNDAGSQGSSVGILTINGQAYVSTVDLVMDDDCIELLKLFEKAKEGISRREAMDELRWSEERAVDALQKLMREGIVWLDLPPQAMPPLYWCLCMT